MYNTYLRDKLRCACCRGCHYAPDASRTEYESTPSRTFAKLFTLLDLCVCVSSLRRGHANILCIVPILTDDPRRESAKSHGCARPVETLRGKAVSSQRNAGRIDPCMSAYEQTPATRTYASRHRYLADGSSIAPMRRMTVRCGSKAHSGQGQGR